MLASRVMTAMIACGAAVLVACGSSAVAGYGAVPDDEIKPLGCTVTGYLTLNEIIQEFETHHQRSEAILNDYGDGSCSWGTGYGAVVSPPIYHPLVRDTARRVLGYIDAHNATGEAIYKQRAREGLEYLLKEQCPDGQFIWWYGDPENGRVENPEHPEYAGSSLYVTGIPTAALMKGYKLFNDNRYLAAANKACDFLLAMPNVPKANYDLFGTWALAANYEVTKNTAYLNRATDYALYAIGSSGSGYQLPSGMWSDSHHQQIWYHSINLRGLAMLLSVMPEDDPNRQQIQQATYKTINHLRDRQQADGSLLAKPADTTGMWRTTFAAQSIAIVAARLDWPVIDSLRLISKSIPYSESNPEGCRGERGDYIMAIGSLVMAYSGIHIEPVGRHVFYNRSAFDGFALVANSWDDDAIATDKAALLPGQTAAFANYTSYSLGINGIMVDIPYLPGTPMAADFEFKVGNDNDPDNWPAAPAPLAVMVREGKGVGGSGRVSIVWNDNLIQKQWLQVTVKATAATGLTAPDVFYFGNAIGETGNSATDAKVTPTDQIGVRNNPHTLTQNPAGIEDAYDINRDRKVGPTDENAVRNNGTNSETALKLITVP